MKLVKLMILGLLLGSIWFPLAAFKFYPISMDFSSSGPGSINNFQAVNDTDQTIALKVTILARTMDASGKDVLVENPDAFQIYPSRMVLKKDQQQRIRIQYRGTAVTDAELAFRVIVEQVPVDFAVQENTGGLKILFRYVGSLYVVSPKPGHKVVVTGLEKISSLAGPRLRITLTNQGNSHVIMNKLTLTIQSGNAQTILSPEQLTGLDGSNLLAGAVHTLDIPWPEKLVPGELSGKIDFEAEK